MDLLKKEQLKSIILLTGVVLLTIMIGFLPASWFGIKSTGVKYKKLDLTKPASIKDVAIDTNNNGTIDWDEFISQTTGKTQLETSLFSKNKPDQKIVEALNDPNNITTSFSKNLYVTSAYIKQYGGGQESDKNGIVSKLLEDESAKVAFTPYTYKDLKISANESPSTMKRYGNNIGAIITIGIKSGLALNDLDALQSFVKNNQDSYALSLLKEKASTAATIVISLRDTEVPPSAVAYHLSLLNSVAEYSNMMGNISSADTDPLRASISFNRYQEITGVMLKNIATLSQYFTSQNINFSKDDSGYIFSSSYTTK